MQWIVVPAMLCALSIADSGCRTCNGSCVGPYIDVSVPPDRLTDVQGIDVSGACSAVVCGGQDSRACEVWQVTLTSTGQCTVNVHHAAAPDDVFTTTVSRVDGCCAGLAAAKPFFDVPSLPGAPSSCPQTIAQRCAEGDPPAGQLGVHCASTLGAAEHDTALCMAPFVSEGTCGTLTVIDVSNSELSYLSYYDASGALIAITGEDPAADEQCLAGPGTFAIPSAACTDFHPLPACVHPVDAATAE